MPAPATPPPWRPHDPPGTGAKARRGNSTGPSRWQWPHPWAGRKAFARWLSLAHIWAYRRLDEIRKRANPPLGLQAGKKLSGRGGFDRNSQNQTMKIVLCSGYTSLVLALTLAPLHSQAADKKVPTISVAKTDASGVASWQPAM